MGDRLTSRVGARPARLLLVVALALGLPLLASGPALAHPLGNFTANAAARLVVGQETTRIDYVLDLAEVPALQTRQSMDADRDGAVGAAEADRYRERTCGEISAAQSLLVDGERIPAELVASALTFPEGQAGLVTLRLECVLTVPTGALAEGTRLEYADTGSLDRVGWREVTAVGDRLRLAESDVPESSLSDRLRAYPESLLSAPLDVTTARLVVGPPGGPAGPPPPVDLSGNGPGSEPSSPGGVLRQAERLTTAFTDLVARQDLTVAFALFAAALAAVLGTLHALAPGHGKTVMAAYLVGREGTMTQAIALGTTVAITHTLGVLVLGVLLTLTQALAPERLYPWLGLASGLLFAAVGASLLRTARRRPAHDHGHDHGHDHHHGADHAHAHGHDHDHDHAAKGGSRGLTWRSLVAPGLAGGLVPSPSALVVLLGGIALGRAWFGIVLVLAYGIGMAAALVGAGYLLLRARALLAARMPEPGGQPGRLQRLTAALPALTAGMIVVGGLAIAVRSLVAI